MVNGHVVCLCSFFDAISERFMGASTFSKMAESKGAFSNNTNCKKVFIKPLKGPFSVQLENYCCDEIPEL